jgi:hypothetical protein
MLKERRQQTGNNEKRRRWGASTREGMAGTLIRRCLETVRAVVESSRGQTSEASGSLDHVGSERVREIQALFAE